MERLSPDSMSKHQRIAYEVIQEMVGLQDEEYKGCAYIVVKPLQMVDVLPSSAKALRELEINQRPIHASRIAYANFLHLGEIMAELGANHLADPSLQPTNLHDQHEYWGIISLLLIRDVTLTEPRLPYEREDLFNSRRKEIQKQLKLPVRYDEQIDRLEKLHGVIQSFEPEEKVRLNY